MKIRFGVLVALAAFPASAQGLDDNAVKCARRAEPEIAIPGCTAVIASRDAALRDVVAAYMNRAWAYSVNHRDNDMMSDLNAVLRLDPANAEAISWRGAHYVQIGTYDLAIADFDESLRLRPDHAPTLDSRGAAFLKMGRLDQAISDFDAAVRIGHFTNSLYARGVAKVRKGDKAGGEADIAAAKTYLPDVAARYDKYYGVEP